MKEILLTRDKVALVDDADYDTLIMHSWHVIDGPRGNQYAASHINGKHVVMHSIILPVEKPSEIDHKNHNGLDNQRKNLRECTHAQNIANSRKLWERSSRHKGVSWSKVVGKWHAYIMKDYKRYHLGYFIDENDAAIAYNTAATTMFGEFANLNRVEEALCV